MAKIFNVQYVLLVLVGGFLTMSNGQLDGLFPQNLVPNLSNIPLLGGGGSGASRNQGGLMSMIRDFDRFVPFVGACDRIVYQGVANCMTNFGPSKSSKGPCCSYRKYRACISGLRDGHSFAVARDRCPAQSFSMPVIWGVSDRLVGLPLSGCPKNSCKK